MKKLVLATIIIGFNFAVKSQELPLTIYGGLNTAGASTSDFSNFDISDWQQFGLNSLNPGGNEGRVNVDLTSRTPKKINLGIVLGARYGINDKFSALAEIQYAVSGISMLGIYLGVNYNIINGEKFSLGLTPKLGYNTGSADLGEIEVLPGYVPPVVLPEGTFRPGDALSMEFSGLAVNLGVTPSYVVSQKISVMAFLGYNLGFTSSDGLLCNGVILPMTAQGVVKSDGLNTQAGLNPNIKSSGLNFQIGISYKF